MFCGSNMKINEKNEVVYSDDEELVAQFVEWTEEAITEMRQLVDAMEGGQPRSSDTVVRVYDLTHNIKGMGGSFNFDLMTVVGTTLCTYLKNLDGDESVNKRILEAHVRTFEVILKSRIVGDGGAQGEALKQRLQTIITENS